MKSKLEAIDQTRIREMTELGGPALLNELIELFLKSSVHLLKEVESGCRERDALKVASACHSMKSSAASLGAARVAELCAVLEKQGRRGHLDDNVSDVAVQLSAEYQKAVSELIIVRTQQAA